MLSKFIRIAIVFHYCTALIENQFSDISIGRSELLLHTVNLIPLLILCVYLLSDYTYVVEKFVCVLVHTNFADVVSTDFGCL